MMDSLKFGASALYDFRGCLERQQAPLVRKLTDELSLSEDGVGKLRAGLAGDGLVAFDDADLGRNSLRDVPFIAGSGRTPIIFPVPAFIMDDMQPSRHHTREEMLGKMQEIVEAGSRINQFA